MSGLTLTEFLGRLASEFDLEGRDPPLAAETRLRADLGFDSLDLLRLSIFLDALAGVLVPEDLELVDEITLGDVHYYYLTLLSNRDEG